MSEESFSYKKWMKLDREEGNERQEYSPPPIEFKLEDFSSVEDGEKILSGTVLLSKAKDTGSVLTPGGKIYCHEKFKGHEGRVDIIKTGDGFKIEKTK
ncbi:MAG: hypothetical protein HQ538_06225 [Parcubacteria group bacterium]|nr:hypothetical protein [Parcubacteria group bacterium]